MFERFYGKVLTDIKAFGKDEFDFTVNLCGCDFDVGEFGYTVLKFADEELFMSVEGIAEEKPGRNDIIPLVVEQRTLDKFIGRKLISVNFDGGVWYVQFEGLDILECRYEQDDRADRAYFSTEFPWF